MLSCSFLSVCPIHLHFGVSTWISIISWLEVFHKSAFEMKRGHRIPRMDCKHLFTKVWSLSVMFFVTRQVSAPYSKTAFTLLLKKGFDKWQAVLALPIRAFTSCSEPPSVETTLPRYVKDSTSSSAMLSSSMGLFLVMLILINFILLLLMFSPTDFATGSLLAHDGGNGRGWQCHQQSRDSEADMLKSTGCLIIKSSEVVLIIQSVTSRKSRGERRQHWCTPGLAWKGSESCPS